jgi:group I intron endonuclease
MNSGIYQIVNKINGKRYIGSSVNIERRLGWHKSRLNSGKHHSVYLQRAWNKYGEGSFEFEISEEVLDKAILLETEQRHLDSLNPEYNMSPTAGGGDQGKEARRKISLALSGINNGMYGKTHSDEIRKRISESHKGRKFSDEHKEKIRLSSVGKHNHFGQNHPMYGKHHTAETKRKISESLRNKSLGHVKEI